MYEYLQDAIDAAGQWDVIEVYWDYDMSPYDIETQIVVDKQVRITGIDTGAGFPRNFSRLRRNGHRLQRRD
jgi:hypothetical protein